MQIAPTLQRQRNDDDDATLSFSLLKKAIKNAPARDSRDYEHDDDDTKTKTQQGVY